MFSEEATVDLSDLPELSSFESDRLETFILDTEGMAHVSRAQPFMGSDASPSSCGHNGAHVHFEDTAADYSVNILAPASGTISYVDPCKLNGDHDKYDIWLTFAKQDDQPVRLMLSIEPMAGQICSGGNEGSDNGNFSSFIDVATEDEVAAGQVIARFDRKAATLPGDDAAHIHYALRIDSATACPDVFSASIRSSLFALFNLNAIPTACQALPFSEGSALCVMPASSENPF